MKTTVKFLLVGLLTYSLHHSTTEASASNDNEIELSAGQVELHNDRAETDSDCPPEGDWWHFVLTPNGGDYQFVSMDLNLDGTTVTVLLRDMVLNVGQLDNVFVAVPDGFTITDLTKKGSAAVYEPGGSKVKFVLSHVCEAPTPPTTTVPPTTVPETTVPPTTTTPPTTPPPPPTRPPETTSTTTTVPETTAPPTTTTPPPDTPKLPTTGTGNSVGVFALWTAAIGGVILAARRRLSTSR